VVTFHSIASVSFRTGKIQVFLLILLTSLSGCKKKEDEDSRAKLTNCQLPIADGRGGVAIGGFPRYEDRLKSIGDVNATVILVDFPDSPASMSPEAAFAKISGASDTFAEMSYSRMNYKLNPVLRWYRMSQASTQYKTNNYADHLAYIKEAVNLADPDVDFSSTDSLVILANPDTTGLGEQGPAMAVSSGSGVTADGRELLNIATSAHDLNNWGSIWLNHEVTHTLGLVDLYAYDREDSSNPYDLLRYAGMYSYMTYNSFEANAPGLLAWERWVLGWLDDEQVACVNPFKDGDVTELVTPIGKSGGLKALVIPMSETSALVVESRRASGIDKNIRKTGALVYLVDSSIPSGKGPIRVYPASADDPLFLQATRAAGESVEVDGLRVEVSTGGDEGDTVTVKEIKKKK
jgi:M6 family metalloprotease-like protein